MCELRRRQEVKGGEGVVSIEKTKSYDIIILRLTLGRYWIMAILYMGAIAIKFY